MARTDIAVQVGRFEVLAVDEHEFPDAKVRELLHHVSPEAAYADHGNTATGQLLLAFPAEESDVPIKAIRHWNTPRGTWLARDETARRHSRCLPGAGVPRRSRSRPAHRTRGRRRRARDRDGDGAATTRG